MTKYIHSYTIVLQIRAMLHVPKILAGLTFYEIILLKQHIFTTSIPLLHAFALYSSLKVDSIYIHVYECIFIFDVEFLRSWKNFKEKKNNFELFCLVLNLHLCRAVLGRCWVFEIIHCTRGLCKLSQPSGELNLWNGLPFPFPSYVWVKW